MDDPRPKQILAALRKMQPKHVVWMVAFSIEGTRKRIEEVQNAVLRLRAFPDQETGSRRDVDTNTLLAEREESLQAYYGILRVLMPLHCWLMCWNVENDPDIMVAIEQLRKQWER